MPNPFKYDLDTGTSTFLQPLPFTDTAGIAWTEGTTAYWMGNNGRVLGYDTVNDVPEELNPSSFTAQNHAFG